VQDAPLPEAKGFGPLFTNNLRGFIMFRGSMVAIVTPFTNSGAIDETALRALVEEQIQGGTDALIPCGTTGEAPTLSIEEQQRVIQIVVEETRGRVPIIAGAGSNDTRHSAHLAANAREVKADGLLVVTPYYNKPTPDGLVAHYREISKAAKLPIVLYHVPSRTGASIDANTLLKIVDAVPDVRSIKEATGSMLVIQAFYAALGDRLTYLSGDDETTLPFLAAGGDGMISVTANVAPARVASVYDAFVAKDVERARREHYALLSLHQAMFLEVNPGPVKAALAMMGKIKTHLRLPMAPITAANEAKLREALLAHKLVKA
jgi:4-hydroxy-tetrahydrodipicolinate synthase